MTVDEAMKYKSGEELSQGPWDLVDTLAAEVERLRGHQTIPGTCDFSFPCSNHHDSCLATANGLRAEVERLQMELTCSQIQATDRGESYREASAEVKQLRAEVEGLTALLSAAWRGLGG